MTAFRAAEPSPSIRRSAEANAGVRMSAPYAEYEAAKWRWLATNPDCTPEQYAEACRTIAEQLGV